MVAAPSSSFAGCGDTSSGGLNLSAGKCKTFKKARLVNGKAIAPATAPARVKKVIAWGNRIRNKPYRYGGGHGSFFDSGYDCSGTMSFALRGGKFVRSPLDSTGYMRWGKKGAGTWITTYANPGHAYIVVAGLRLDTSQTPGNGPGWSKSMRSTSGSFIARHPRRY
jgi:cell wall-associated NlpC family hydrolase